MVGVRAPVLALRTQSCRWKQEDAPNRRLCVRGGNLCHNKEDAESALFEIAV